MSDWKEMTWGNISTLEYGKSLKNYQESKGKIPVYGTNGQIGFTDSEPLCNFPSVIIGRKGAYRGVHFSHIPFFVIDTAFYLKPISDDNIDLKFAYYKLLNQDINRLDSGSAIPSTSRPDFYQLDLLLPPLYEQKSIADVLSCLDAKIDNLRRQNETLEQIARSLFKHWFIDFEFPNADGKPYKSSGGAMVASELSNIPDGWRVGKLEDLTKISTGKGLKKDDFKKNGAYPVLGANGEMGKTDKLLTEEECILTGRVGTLGVVNISYSKVWISDNVIIFNSIDNFFYYVYFCLKNTNIKNLNRGSTQPLITQSDLKIINISIPAINFITDFQASCEKVFNKKKLNEKQIQTLTKTRDALLPKLMSGQIRIKE